LKHRADIIEKNKGNTMTKRPEINDIEISGNHITEIFQISNRVLSQWKSDPNFPQPTPNKKYNLVEVIRFAKNANKKSSNEGITAARILLTRLQARRTQLQIRERENELVEISHAKDQVQKMLQKIKSVLEKIPHDISKQCYGKNENEIQIVAQKVISQAINKFIDDAVK